MTFRPDELPRSPTGRIPQWVLDEAAGLTSAPSEWRQADPLLLAPLEQPSSRRSWIVALLIVALAVTSAARWLFDALGDRDLGPDYSALVVSRAASELPPAVETSRTMPWPGFEEAAAPLGTPPTVEAPSTSFAFARVQDDVGSDDAPVSWSPCRPIHFVVNPAGAPEGFADQVVAAAGAASAATGLIFVNDGVTDEPAVPDRAGYQPDRYGDRWAPVLVAFADDTMVPDLKNRVVGQASVLSFPDRSTRVRSYVTGRLYLDLTLLKNRERGEVPAYVPVLRHELGHLLGLTHVDDKAQLMYPTTGAPATYQPGDLTGLAYLGQGACAPRL